MRIALFILLLISTLRLVAQSSSDSQPSGSSSSKSPAHTPDLTAPRSDRVRASEIPDGQSSSKDTQIDLSAPPDDAKAHPRSADILMDAETAPGNADVSEFRPYDPHKAAKDVEVGDFYFKKKNYIAAEDRYREALYYKDNDAVATFRLGICLEKMNRPDEARVQFENYLKILPHGPEAGESQKAIDRLKSPAASAKASH